MKAVCLGFFDISKGFTMKTTAKLIALTLFSLVSAFAVASCTSEKAASDIDAVKKAGKLTVGITEYEPMD